MQPDAKIMEELWIFLKAARLGLLLALAYDFIRVSRRLLPRGLFLVSVEDVCYWAASGLLLWDFMYRVTDGKPRFYVMFSIAVSAAVYSLIKKALKKRWKADKIKWKERHQRKGE